MKTLAPLILSCLLLGCNRPHEITPAELQKMLADPGYQKRLAEAVRQQQAQEEQFRAALRKLPPPLWPYWQPREPAFPACNPEWLPHDNLADQVIDAPVTGSVVHLRLADKRIENFINLKEVRRVEDVVIAGL